MNATDQGGAMKPASGRSSARQRATRAACGAGLAVCITLALSTAAGAATPPGTPPGSLVSPLALGLNSAPWDYIYAANTSADGGVNTIQPLLQAASIGLLRYGGGSYADAYDWQTNSNIENCLPGDPTASYVVTSSSCATADSLDFDQFSAQAKAVSAQSFVTVNYGSGTPAELAAWVTHAQTTPGDSV